MKGVKASGRGDRGQTSLYTKRSDYDIPAAAAIHRLAWNVWVPKDSVIVKVAEQLQLLTDGWIGGIERRIQQDVILRFWVS